jgi:hypothetical protein
MGIAGDNTALDEAVVPTLPVAGRDLVERRVDPGVGDTGLMELLAAGGRSSRAQQ